MLDVSVRVARVGNSSISFELAIDHEGDRLMTGGVVARISVRVPQVLRQAVQPSEGGAVSSN